MLNDITGTVIDSAMKVHRILGPGLLESAYRTCLAHELRKRGLDVLEEHPLPISYDGLRLDAGYRLDLLVERHVVVELKAVKRIHELHEAHLLSHLKLGDYRVGLLINFHVVLLKDGIPSPGQSRTVVPKHISTAEFAESAENSQS